MTAGPTNKRTTPKIMVRMPATINPIDTLALLMAMIANDQCCLMLSPGIRSPQINELRMNA